MGGRCKKQVKKETEPKNAHGIQFNLNVNSEDADKVREALISAGHVEIAEDFEVKRELTIMHEVMTSKGSNIYEKIDNCLETWRKGDYNCGVQDIREPKYKMTHKVLAK